MKYNNKNTDYKLLRGCATDIQTVNNAQLFLIKKLRDRFADSNSDNTAKLTFTIFKICNDEELQY